MKNIFIWSDMNYSNNAQVNIEMAKYENLLIDG